MLEISTVSAEGRLSEDLAQAYRNSALFRCAWHRAHHLRRCHATGLCLFNLYIESDDRICYCTCLAAACSALGSVSQPGGGTVAGRRRSWWTG